MLNAVILTRVRIPLLRIKIRGKTLKCESVKIVRGGFAYGGRFYKHDALRTFEGHTLAFQKGKVYKNFMDMIQQCDPICEFEIKD